MEKLDILELRKKISRIIFGNQADQSTAWTYPKMFPEVLAINLNGIFARDQKFWEKNIVVIITHENLHSLIFRLEGLMACRSLDILWKSTWKSRFLVDGRTKWFKWREFKRKSS